MFPKIDIKFRHMVGVIPALIFWGCSMLFFVLGLSMDDRSGTLLWVAIGLAFANTVVQWIGWDSTYEELGSILYWSWMASYVLGISTNVVALVNILSINNQIMEYVVAASLGSIIEITPERLFVLAWRSISPKRSNPRYVPKQQNKHGDRREQTQPHKAAQRHGVTNAERVRDRRAAGRRDDQQNFEPVNYMPLDDREDPYDI